MNEYDCTDKCPSNWVQTINLIIMFLLAIAMMGLGLLLDH